MNAHIAIVAHMQRFTLAQFLANHVSANYATIDDGTIGCEQNHKLAWQWHQHNPAQWSITIEDDAFPVAMFETQLENALRAAPSPLVSLYLGRLRPPQWQPKVQAATIAADHADASWIIGVPLIHAVGVALRGDLVTDMLDGLEQAGPMPIDEAISTWALTRRITTAYTWPSLVDHRDTYTLINHRDHHPRLPGRTAWRVGVRPEWSDRSVSL